jgi:nucleolar pre-ribosomal-associated protein 1
VKYSKTFADIRTSYIFFLLSFVDVDSTTLVKTVFLEQHRDVFLSIFRGLGQDSYPVVQKILEICWGGILADPKLKRTLKIGLFNESTIAQVCLQFFVYLAFKVN